MARKEILDRIEKYVDPFRNRGSQAGDPGLRLSVKERQSLLE